MFLRQLALVKAVFIFLSFVPAIGAADRVDVFDGASLHDALVNARPGDEIVLHAGHYRGIKTESPEGKRHYFFSHRSGARTRPITVRSYSVTDMQTLRGNSPNESGYVFYLTGDHWIIRDLRFESGQKGIMLDSASFNVLDNVEVRDVRDEGVHFRSSSKHNVLQNCLIQNTGRKFEREGYGEAVYVGSHDGDQTGDHSDHNRIGGCQLGAGVTAELIDIKEGTVGTIVEHNTLLATSITGQNFADSFIDIKGTEVIVRHNRMDAGGNAVVDHAIHILRKEQHRSSNIYDNHLVMNDGSTFLKIGRGVSHVRGNTFDYVGEFAKYYGNGTTDSVIDSDLPDSRKYLGFNNSHDTEEPVETVSDSCFKYVGQSKTEINTTATPCIEFDDAMPKRLVQVWDSNVNTSCNFRGIVESRDSTSQLHVNANYASTRKLTGSRLDIKSANGCPYILFRAY